MSNKHKQLRMLLITWVIGKSDPTFSLELIHVTDTLEHNLFEIPEIQ